MTKLKLSLQRKFYKNYLFLFLCIVGVALSSGHALMTIWASNNSTIYIKIFFIMCFFPSIIKYFLKNGINKVIGSYLFLLYMVFLTSFVNGFTDIGFYLNFIITITFGLGISVSYNFDSFIKVYLKVMKIISYFAILGYVIANFTNIFSSIPVQYNINGVGYKILYLFNYISLVPERNAGLFWEPGLFASFLIVAMVFEFAYKKEKYNLFNIIIFTICIITTMSAAGFALLFFVIYVALLSTKSKTHKSYGYTVFSMGIIIIGIMFIAFSPEIIRILGLQNNLIFSKLLSDSLIQSSRFTAFIHNLEVFKINPIFGTGITRVAEHMVNVADTSTSTYLISIFGVNGFLYTLFWVIAIMQNISISWQARVSILIIFLSVINKEPHYNMVITWVLLFYFLGFSKKRDKKFYE